jgi:hypothetical protein
VHISLSRPRAAANDCRYRVKWVNLVAVFTVALGLVTGRSSAAAADTNEVTSKAQSIGIAHASGYARAARVPDRNSRNRLLKRVFDPATQTLRHTPANGAFSAFYLPAAPFSVSRFLPPTTPDLCFSNATGANYNVVPGGNNVRISDYVYLAMSDEAEATALSTDDSVSVKANYGLYASVSANASLSQRFTSHARQQSLSIIFKEVIVGPTLQAAPAGGGAFRLLPERAKQLASNDARFFSECGSRFVSGITTGIVIAARLAVSKLNDDQTRSVMRNISIHADGGSGLFNISADAKQLMSELQSKSNSGTQFQYTATALGGGDAAGTIQTGLAAILPRTIDLHSNTDLDPNAILASIHKVMTTTLPGLQNDPSNLNKDWWEHNAAAVTFQFQAYGYPGGVDLYRHDDDKALRVSELTGLLEQYKDLKLLLTQYTDQNNSIYRAVMAEHDKQAGSGALKLGCPSFNADPNDPQYKPVPNANAAFSSAQLVACAAHNLQQILGPHGNDGKLPKLVEGSCPTVEVNANDSKFDKALDNDCIAPATVEIPDDDGGFALSNYFPAPQKPSAILSAIQVPPPNPLSSSVSDPNAYAILPTTANPHPQDAMVFHNAFAERLVFVMGNPAAPIICEDTGTFSQPAGAPESGGPCMINTPPQGSSMDYRGYALSLEVQDAAIPALVHTGCQQNETGWYSDSQLCASGSIIDALDFVLGETDHGELRHSGNASFHVYLWDAFGREWVFRNVASANWLFANNQRNFYLQSVNPLIANCIDC